MARFVLVAVLALAAACALAACGGDDSAAGDSAGGLAEMAPPDSVGYADVVLRPRGDLKREADAVAAEFGDGEDFPDVVAKLLEFDGREAERLDFTTDVEPWLGPRMAWYALELGTGPDGESDGGAILAVSDPEKAHAFVGKMGRGKTDRYRGIRYGVGSEGDAAAFVGDTVVIAEGVAALKAAIDASSGESLADLDRFGATMAEAPNGSLADVYLDFSALAADAGEPDFFWAGALAGSGLDPDRATAVASVLPRADSLEIEVRAALDGDRAPEGDVGELLATMPADSAVALGFAEFGRILAEQFEALDESGIPGEVPPNQFRAVFDEAGVDLDALAGSLGDAAGFMTPTGTGEPRGALAIESEAPRRARNSLANLDFFLRSTGVPGVTGIGEEGVRGFAIADDELGDEPIAFVADGERVAVGYGIAPALRALKAEGRTLGDVAAFREAIESLGETPPYGFIDGPGALRLLDREYADDEEEDEEEYRDELRPYLARVATVAIGAEREGDLSLTRLIVAPKR